MHLLTSLILLPMAFLVSCTIGDPYAIENLSTVEAATLMRAIVKYRNALEDRIQVRVDELAGYNDLLVKAVRPYRSLHKYLQGSHCSDENALVQSDEDLMMSFINNCKNKISSDGINEYDRKVLWYMDKVKEIDNSCVAYPSSCEKTKQRLNNIFTSRDKSYLDSKADSAYNKYEKKLVSCFERDTKDLQKRLMNSITVMKWCLSR